jgi:hypothetical protein
MVEKTTKRKLDGENGKTNKASAKTCGETSPGIKNKDRKMSGKIVEPKVKSNSSYDMLSWQLKTLLGQVQQIELHESGDCPCILNTQDPPERCLGKHLLNISTLSRETANMSSQNKEWLLKLAGEANERHEQFKKFICHTEDLPKLTDWARNWRKQYIEPVYYACKVTSPDEANLENSLAKTGKPIDQNTPAGSCTREDLKN